MTATCSLAGSEALEGLMDGQTWGGNSLSVDWLMSSGVKVFIYYVCVLRNSSSIAFFFAFFKSLGPIGHLPYTALRTKIGKQ